jgi:hypothetical protein
MRRVSTILRTVTPLDPDEFLPEDRCTAALLSAVRSCITLEDMHEWWGQYATSETHRYLLQSVYGLCSHMKDDPENTWQNEVHDWALTVAWASAFDWMWAK